MDIIKNAPPKIPFFNRVGSRLLHEFRHRFYIFLAVLVIALLVNELYLFGTDFSQWDPLLISGALTFIFGVRLAVNMPDVVDDVLTRLIHRGALDLGPVPFSTFKQRLEEQTSKYAHWFGLIIASAVLIAFLVVFRLQQQILLMILESLGGYIAGQFLGRAVSYGRLAHLLKNTGISIQVQPGHLDGVAGLKPVGDLYFFQAMLIAIPAVYLAIWWLIIPLWPGYMEWREPYVGLLAIMLALEFLAFLLPIWSFHTEMQKQRNELLKEADGLSHEIVVLQSQLVQSKSEPERGELKERLALMTQRYWDIEKMPTWPVDIKVQRKFTFGNLGLFLPLLTRFLNIQTDAGRKLWEEIAGIFVRLFE